MKRGTTPACRYCSTVDTLRTERRAMRRFGRLLIPDLALHELDGVTRRVPHVHRAPAEWPGDLALDLDARTAQLRGEVVQPPVGHPEGNVAVAGCPVRWDEAARCGAALRREEQQQAAVWQPERRGVLVGSVDRSQPGDLAVEAGHRDHVVRIEHGLVDALYAWRGWHAPMIAVG